MYMNENLFFNICGKLTLSKKKGHVAPKCVSASNKIVININWVSNPGNRYNTLKYKIGKIIGNLTKKTSFLRIVFIINQVQIYFYNLFLNLYFVYFFLNNNFQLLEYPILFP